jgi:N utilization substance protein B
MPVLHERTDRAGHFLVAVQEGRELAYALAPEGERFLTMVLGMKPGDACRVADLNLLLERGWATLAAPGDAHTDTHREDPQPRAQPVAPREDAPAASGALTSTASAISEPGRVPSSRRTRGREVALQILYLLEQNPAVDPAQVEQFLTRRLRDPKLVSFTQGLIDGVRAHQTHIDGLISAVAENWRLDRMATIDRNILRLGAYELVYCPEIPSKVAINEALELAKRYSTSQSSRFVNGLLDRLQGSGREVLPGPAAQESEPRETPRIEGDDAAE